MIEEHIILKESLFKVKYSGNLEIIDKHIEHILTFDQGRKGSNKGGYQSHDITFGFQELLTFIKNAMQSIDNETVFSNFWLNINKGNSFNNTHVHSLHGWSCVYYHKVCCDKTPIYFENLVPRIQVNQSRFVPTNQDIVFFRSYIPHGVDCCKNQDHERVSFAFNFNLTRDN